MKVQILFSGKIWKLFQNAVCWNVYTARLALIPPLLYCISSLTVLFRWAFNPNCFPCFNIPRKHVYDLLCILLHIHIHIKYYICIGNKQKQSNWDTEFSCNIACAPSEDSDQPAHPCSLIRVFAVCLNTILILGCPQIALWRLISLWRFAVWSVSSVGALAILQEMLWPGSVVINHNVNCSVPASHNSTLSMLGKIFSSRHFEIFFYFFIEHRLWQFMRIVSFRRQFAEISKPIFWE